MKKSKVLLTLMCAVALVVTSVFGTLAYLQDTDEVKNTFTVGNVQIKLDEKDITKTDGTRTEEGNKYHLLPGHVYDKDPTVTVLKGSESSYIKMTVTFSNAKELDAIFAPTGANLTSIFGGYDAANWIAKGNTEDTQKNTRTYEFWYKETVAAPEGNVELDALFDTITVPGTINNDQLKTIAGMTITVNAYAIQADGFANAEAAWAAAKF